MRGTKPSASPSVAVRARSRSKRASAASLARWRSLSATVRPSGARARKTTPTPPRPISPWTSYSPTFTRRLLVRVLGAEREREGAQANALRDRLELGEDIDLPVELERSERRDGRRGRVERDR